MKTVEDAYKEYHIKLKRDKIQLVVDLDNVLIAMGLWNVDVVRKHDGAIGQLKVFISKTPGKDPSIQFYQYRSKGRLSKHYSGMIPTENTEKYISELFSVEEK